MAFCSWELHAQNVDSRAIVDRLEALEKQVAELNTLLRALLPPPPIEQVTPFALNIANAPTKGSSAAKIAVVEFSDFECPYCGRHAQTVYPQLQRQYIDNGTLMYVFRHFPLQKLHPNAFKAAEAAECARDQGKFWEMHDRLFTNQKALTESDLSNHAGAIGVDSARFKPCLSNGTKSSRVKEDAAEGERLELQATPSFFIGRVTGNGQVLITRKISGALALPVFQTAIDQVMKSDGR